MKGRPTTDPKVNTLRIRLNDEMNQWLFRTSENKGITVSQLMREIVEHAMKSTSNFSQKIKKDSSENGKGKDA